MTAHSSFVAGGPLLRVADMLQDLGEDDSIVEPILKKTSLTDSPWSSSSSSSSPQLLKSDLEKQDLAAAFEETYSELNVALTQSGHLWTGLTQELCATLTTADKLVATSQLNLGPLSQEVKKLENIVEKGQAAVTRLQIAIEQINDQVRNS